MLLTLKFCDSPPPAVIPVSVTICCGASSVIVRSTNASSVGGSFGRSSPTCRAIPNVASCVPSVFAAPATKMCPSFWM